MGKGSRQRPCDRVKFNSEWERIFKEKPATRKQTPDHGRTQQHIDKKREQKKRGFED